MILACIVGFVAALVGLGKWSRAAARKKRYEYLMAKYGNEEVVQSIITRTVFNDMTASMLLECLGTPADKEIKATKKKQVEVWKYDQTGVNRFNLRITLENGLVASVQRKSGG